MKNYLRMLFLSLMLVAVTTSAQTLEEKAQRQLVARLPGTTAIGPVKVDKVTVNNSKNLITVKCNGNAAYIPLTIDALAELKADIKADFGKQYAAYDVAITSDGRTFDELALFAKKKYVSGDNRSPFVTRLDRDAAPLGLDGANIAMWQSHGWYFEQKLNRWEWQRARIFQTVEDLYTQSYVMPFLMPMLENAGAYVMSPRERDINRVEIIVDNDGGEAFAGYSEKGKWKDAQTVGFAMNKKELRDGDNPFRDGSARVSAADPKGEASATWSAEFPQSDSYAVYVSYPSLKNSAPDAIYTVHAADGDHRFRVNQRMGGGTWIYLGHFPFERADHARPVVTLTNKSSHAGAVVGADAVKIGGGMGNIARKVTEPTDSLDYEYSVSGYPRFTEGARYFLQWAGAPDSVFTPSDYLNDYTDDYRSRGLWVNWLAGGSSVLPGREGLNIPVDLSFAFHSDAGTTLNDSIIGTLGIYSTANGTHFPNGTSHLASRDLTDIVMTNIVSDIRRSFEPSWTRRGMWDKSYFEARVPEVPAMLLELLSHQNFADMKYGLDPAFRFVVSRAIYKGILQFIAHRDGRPYVVQPLPVRAFAIAPTVDEGLYRLSWKATVDSLELSAVPTYYIIEERVGEKAYRQIAKVSSPEYIFEAKDHDLHAFRIVAGNEGGVSFPSETLAMQHLGNSSRTVTVVNGFTRVSAPDWFESGDSIKIGGFYDQHDHGVPYLYDISFIGSQFEFRRTIPWMDDDAAGFGASRANYEDKVIAGNTFDYTIDHGQAIAAAGHSFVSSSVEAFVESSERPEIVDIIFGKQKEIARGRGFYGTSCKTFTPALQGRLSSLAADGCDIFVSGSYVASDLADNPFSSAETREADCRFAADVLGYKWRVGQASLDGEARQVATRYKSFTGGEYDIYSTLNADSYVVESPDALYPADTKTGATLMRYTENNIPAATVYSPESHRAVVLGFPFEAIKSEDSRKSLMKQILNFFDKR